MKNTHPNAQVNGARGAARTLGNLRNALRQRRVKLTDVARSLDVPYRSLQNYFSRNDMPLSVYEAICMYACIPPEYPMNECRMRLDKHALAQAVIDILRDNIPDMKVDVSLESGMDIRIGPPPAEPRDKKALRDAANMLVHLLDSRFDQINELELSRPLADDE